MHNGKVHCLNCLNGLDYEKMGIVLCDVQFRNVFVRQSYDKLWKQVEQAREKSLPQTVIELTDEIYRKGLEERNAAQMLKATECRDAYREYLTPDSLYANLAALEQWAQEEDNAVTRAVLYSLLQDAMPAMRRATAIS